MKKNISLKYWKQLLHLAKPFRGYLYLALFSALIGTGSSLFLPILIGRMIDCFKDPSAILWGRLHSYLLLTLGIVLLSTVFQWLLSYATNALSYCTVRSLRQKMSAKLQRVPLSFLDSEAHGNLMNTVLNDADKVSDGLLQGLTQLFTGVISILGTLIFMLSLDVFTGLLVMVLTPLSLFVASFISKKTYQSFRDQAGVRGEVSAYVEEMVGNLETVKTLSYEERAERAFEKTNLKLYDLGVKAQFYSSLTNPATRFATNTIYALIALFAAFRVLSGVFSVGIFASFLSYANQYTKPFNEIAGVVTQLQEALSSAARIFRILDEEEVKEVETEPEITRPYTVEAKNVEFSYQKDKPFIRDLSFHAKEGQRFAIVGPTGCGKTTLINLLMRFYDTDGGEIRFAGEEIRGLKRSSLRDHMGMVLQDSWLFEGSIAENISYGNPSATREEIIAASKQAGFHSFVLRFEGGYDALVLEDGENLSAGEKQLLCIARVMLSKPDVLILDEATSNLDTRTELKVQEAFENMMKGCTSFVVAHRLSTIRNADCILVMKDGALIESGSHDELLARDSFYSKLYHAQFEGVST